jgi:peptidyl-prolyl cis-trans isomerase A (cyclophilin A)
MQQAPAPPAGTTPAGATQDLPDSPGLQAPPAVEPTGPTAVMDTSMGRITCRLFDKQAPQTVTNFVGLAEGTKDWTDPTTHEKVHGKPLYDGTLFHRVIPGFMAQGGDPMGTGMGDPGYYIPDEIDPSLMFDVPGRLAMANSGPNTDGSQFFVTEEIQPDLNGHYTIFGQCDPSSVLVVKTITRVERDGRDKPVAPVVLKKVTIVPVGQPLPQPLVPASAPASSPSEPPASVPAPPALAPRPN